MESIEILAVVESVSNEKGIDEGIYLVPWKWRLPQHHCAIFMRMQK